MATSIKSRARAPKLTRPCGVMATRLTTNQEIAGSTPVSVIVRKVHSKYFGCRRVSSFEIDVVGS